MRKTDARTVRSSGSLSTANDGSEPRLWTAIWSHKSADNSFICGWNHKVWVFSFLIGTSRTFGDQNWAVLACFFCLFVFFFCCCCCLFCLKPASSSSAPFVLRFSPCSVSRFNKCEFVSPTPKYVSGKHLFHWWIAEIWKSFTWKGIFYVLFNIVSTLGRSSQSLSKQKQTFFSKR